MIASAAAAYSAPVTGAAAAEEAGAVTSSADAVFAPTEGDKSAALPASAQPVTVLTSCDVPMIARRSGAMRGSNATLRTLGQDIGSAEDAADAAVPVEEAVADTHAAGAGAALPWLDNSSELPGGSQGHAILLESASSGRAAASSSP